MKKDNEEINELLKHIYKDAEMASYTIEDLLGQIKNKDNKIKKIIEEILKDYQKFMKDTYNLLKTNNSEPEKSKILDKMGAKIGIDKEVRNDNSDSSIADMLIKGISIGSIEMEKKLKDYEKIVDKKILKLAKDFTEFQTKSIDKLKAYL